tara:strand:+ start:147 stop:464 length:318 start_codon:yes stop_codon:yes gene_type:complete
MITTVTATSQKVLFIIVIVACSLFSNVSFAQCRDFEAIAAANTKAASYFKDGTVFHPGVIQKVHNPSGKKEVASYIKAGEKRYSIFTLVDEDCNVKFRKRTRQGD